jgi:hypothetical protein
MAEMQRYAPIRGMYVLVENRRNPPSRYVYVAETDHSRIVKGLQEDVDALVAFIRVATHPNYLATIISSAIDGVNFTVEQAATVRAALAPQEEQTP